MLTPDQISALRDTAGQLADPINNYLLADIARRIAEAGQLTSTAAYQIWRAQQLGISQAEIKKRLRKLMKKTAEEVDSLLKQTAKVGYEFDLQNLPHADAVPFNKNTTIQQMVTMVAEMTDGELTNITKTLGMVDPYGNAFPLQEIYRKTMDYAFNEVYYGAADYQTAIRRVTSKLARYGVRVIDYKNGKHTSLEAAVRRNVMGGIGLLQEEISQYNYDELGADGWEISAHAASAPDHEPIQGRQYSNEAYEKLNSSLKRRIGTLNCGHVAFPIILGVSEPQYTEEQLQQFVDDNKKGITYQGKQYTTYEATQKQRELERQIRAQKRQVMVDEAAGDDDKLLIGKTRLRILNREYRDFSKETGLPTQFERAEVAGFKINKTTINKVVVDKYAKIRYNKDGIIQVTDDWTTQAHPYIPPQYKPNAVIDTVTQKGKQRDRTIYDKDGWMVKQVHSGNHGHPKHHPYGKHGEHCHDYTWDKDLKKPNKTTREINEVEREKNKDILGGDKNDS